MACRQAMMSIILMKIKNKNKKSVPHATSYNHRVGRWLLNF